MASAAGRLAVESESRRISDVCGASRAREQVWETCHGLRSAHARQRGEEVRHQRFSRNTIRQHLTLSPATVIASLALLVACGGTAFGGTSLGGSFVQGRDGRVHATNGTPGPRGPRGPRGPAGPAGPAGAPGSAFAYAHVRGPGAVDPAASKNVEVGDAIDPGVYCLVVTGGTPKNVTAMIDNSGADPRTSQIAGNVAPGGTAKGCPSGDNVAIVTSSGGKFVYLPFFVAFN
jgi:hypothetical protein